MTKVTFLISAFKARQYLDRCIRNLMQQTLQDFQIVIINPQSPHIEDDEISRKWVEKDKRVCYCPYHKYQTYGESWIYGWSKSEGQYIINCNCDDLRHPLFSQKIVDVMDKDPRIGFAYTGIEIVSEEGKILGYGIKPPFNEEDYKIWCLSGPSVAWQSKLLFDLPLKRLKRAAKLYNSAFDYYLFMSIMKLGYKGYSIPEVLVQYTQRKSSIENSSNSSTWQSLCIIGENYPEALERIAKNEGNELALHFKTWPMVPELESFNQALGGNKIWAGKKINVLEL